MLSRRGPGPTLNHPHILTVHDVGEIDGRHFILTELLDGGNLRQCRPPSRPWTAEGSTAHEGGILHRDIKPENLLISRRLPSSPTSVSPSLTSVEWQAIRSADGTRAVIVERVTSSRAGQSDGTHKSSVGVLLYEAVRTTSVRRDNTVLHVITGHATPKLMSGAFSTRLSSSSRRARKRSRDRYQRCGSNCGAGTGSKNWRVTQHRRRSPRGGGWWGGVLPCVGGGSNEEPASGAGAATHRSDRTRWSQRCRRTVRPCVRAVVGKRQLGIGA